MRYGIASDALQCKNFGLLHKIFILCLASGRLIADIAYVCFDGSELLYYRLGYAMHGPLPRTSRLHACMRGWSARVPLLF